MATGFFNGGLLNFVLDEQKKQSIMNQSVVEKMTNEQEQDDLTTSVVPDNLRPPEPGQPGYTERVSSSSKARQRAWEQYKKANNLTFDEDPEAKRKDGTIIPYKENKAKHEWSKEHYFVNARNFDWEKQRLATLDKETEKEIREGNNYSIFRAKPQYDKRGRIQGYKNVQESPEWVRMSDGSLEKVHTGAHMLDGSDEDKTRAWQNRSELFSATWDAKSNRFIKTEYIKSYLKSS